MENAIVWYPNNLTCHFCYSYPKFEEYDLFLYYSLHNHKLSLYMKLFVETYTLIHKGCIQWYRNDKYRYEIATHGMFHQPSSQTRTAIFWANMLEPFQRKKIVSHCKYIEREREREREFTTSLFSDNLCLYPCCRCKG